MSMIFCYQGSRSSETARVRSPASRLGGGTLGYLQYDKEREVAAGVTVLVPREWSPPPDVAEDNKTIRKTYNEA